jgi:integrase
VLKHKVQHIVARHLWRRGATWTFQFNIPKTFVNWFGATPFRISLGALPTTEAKRRARVLAGYATASLGGVGVSRETVARGLAELAVQLDDLSKQDTRARFEALRASGALNDIDNGDEAFLPEPTAAVHEQRLIIARTERAIIRDMRGRLDKIGREIVHDGDDWKTERQTYDRMVDRLAQQKPVTKDLPILSVAAEEVITAKSEALTDRSASYIARLRRAVRAFAAIIGDKRVSEYSPLDVQKYATTLGLLPKTWASDPRLRDLPPLEIIKKAGTIRGLKPISTTTVAEYVGEFRAVWKVIRASYPHDVLSLAHVDLYITLPRTASRPVKRQGLNVENLNKFLAIAARCRRPDDRFLPLLGALTGARLGELVYLQVGDVQQFQDHWILSLIEDIEDDEGNVDERKLKTDASRRIIALPDSIKETGFLEWVRGLRGGTLWPKLLKTKRPHATASKHMNSFMKQAKVHVPLEQTFHSLRHGYKDYLREMKVADRTADIQVGHALDTVAKTYGSRILRPDEIVTLATLPLQEGLDISPYRLRR